MTGPLCCIGEKLKEHCKSTDFNKKIFKKFLHHHQCIGTEDQEKQPALTPHDRDKSHSENYSYLLLIYSACFPNMTLLTSLVILL